MARAPDHPHALLLCRSPDELEATGFDCDSCSWAEAQQDGQLGFARYDRFLCLPAVFPADVVEHGREEMCSRLRRRMRAGALVVLFVPEANLTSEGVDEGWSRARFVVEQVTGVRLDAVARGSSARVDVASDCPAGIQDHLSHNHPGCRFEVDQNVPPMAISEDESVSLAGFESALEEPCAVAGFPGEGAWLVLPWSPRERSAGDMKALLTLFEDLSSLRSQRLSSLEAKRLALEAKLASYARSAAAASPSAVRKPARPRTPEAPHRSLDGPELYAIPVDGNRGFLQRFTVPKGPYRTSLLLHRGPWALATIILDERWYASEAPDRVPIDVLTQSLRDAEIPAEEMGSLSRYLSELRKALNAVFGGSGEKGLIRLEQRKGVVHMDVLQAALAPFGGAKVRSIRERPSG